MKKKLLDVDFNIEEIRKEKKKIIDNDNGLNDLIKNREKIYGDCNKKSILKNKKLIRGQKEVEEKVKYLPKYLPKIINEVNRRLILDGVEK